MLGLAIMPLICVANFSAARAQQTNAAAPVVFVPNFWDPQRRLERPDLAGVRAIRFITDDEYPPFAFQGADGALAGFNVDLVTPISP